MTFTEQHLAALRLISDTFAPGDGAGIPAASAVGAPEFALEFAGTNPREAELKQLRTLLRLWDMGHPAARAPADGTSTEVLQP